MNLGDGRVAHARAKAAGSLCAARNTDVIELWRLKK
jgi:hypothetical protein